MKTKQQYALYTIAGTEKWVTEEVNAKLDNNIEITMERPGRIELDWVGPQEEFEPVSGNDSGEHQGLLRFQDLLSPTHTAVIGNESHKIKNEFRPWRKAYIGSGGINPSLAYVLCQTAEIKAEDIVYDPFCGSGLLPITAHLYFGVHNFMLSDLSGKAIDASQTNLNAAQIKKREYRLFRSNLSMVKLKPESVDKVITNMPFGIRVGRHSKNENLYQTFISKLNSFLTSEGTAIALTTEKKLLTKAAGNIFNVEELTVVRQSGLNPSIFKLTRKA